MAYEIHITRGEDEIALDEWVAAVAAAEGCRLAEGDYLVTLPETGQVFRFHNTGGDTEVHVAGVWRRVFRWHEGRVSFVGPNDFHIEDTHMRCLVRTLATALQAKVVGDEGRIFD